MYSLPASGRKPDRNRKQPYRFYKKESIPSPYPVIYTGTTGWGAEDCTLDSTGGVVYLTANGLDASFAFFNELPLYGVLGRSIEARADIRLRDASESQFLGFEVQSSNGGYVADETNSPSTSWNTFSVSFVVGSTMVGLLSVDAYAAYNSSSDAAGKVMEIKNVFITDMGIAYADTTTPEVSAPGPLHLVYAARYLEDAMPS